MRTSQLLVFAFSCLLPVLSQAQPIFRGESVEYDPASKRWFTSDDGTSIIQRDSNGVVSYFGTNAHASHGMEIIGGYLFACEGTVIWGYDLATGAQVMSLPIPGSSFLNGLTSNGFNKLYATCFTNKKIFEIDLTSLVFPSVTEIVANTVTKPNGIIYDGPNNRLIFVNWGTNAPIKAVDLNGFAVTTLLSTSLGNMDGIDDDGLGHYYVSSWSPIRISRFDTNFVAAPITVTAPGINNPADICYAQGVDTLGIPNGNGPVTFIGFGPVVGREEAPVGHSFFAYPNPTAASSNLTIELEAVGAVRLDLFDIHGRLLQTLWEGTLEGNKQLVNLQGLGLAQGIYLLHIHAGEAGFDKTIRLAVE